MATQTTTIQGDIRKADDVFEQNFKQGNAAALAELYTNDGMLLPTGSDIVQGKQSIQDFWQGAMNLGIKEAKLNIKEVELQGNLVVELGNYQLRGGSGELMDEGKYIVIWKEEGNQWKLHRDIWNTSRTA